MSPPSSTVASVAVLPSGARSVLVRAALGLGLALTTLGLGAAPSGADEAPPATVTVMTRNLYLGADVGAALDLLPDFPAAAQLMWDQQLSTQFPTRVALLADEAAQARPDVIGLQEAATWSCRRPPFGRVETVLDFTELYLEALRAAGTPYVVAERDGARASNPGYEIPPIPLLTRVHDPETLQPLLRTDVADCGLVISDVLLVREDLAPDVLAVGTSEYEGRSVVVPIVFEIDRGYAWADLAIAGTTVRFVTTHLESRWSAGEEPLSAEQARQLVADLADTSLPLVVVGDFNADPRDPVPAGAPNVEGRPESHDLCPEQPTPLSAEGGDPRCNAYWTMRAAGFEDAGPDTLNPANATWGASPTLAGPDPDLLRAALENGNVSGFTDRLDYVFARNGAVPVRARLVGNEWPDGPTWECSDPEQVATTAASSRILATRGVTDPIADRGQCLPSDHAGVVAVLDVSSGPAGATPQAAPPTHSSLRISLLGWLAIILGGLALVLLVAVVGLVRLVRRSRRRPAGRTGAGGASGTTPLLGPDAGGTSGTTRPGGPDAGGTSGTTPPLGPDAGGTSGTTPPGGPDAGASGTTPPGGPDAGASQGSAEGPPSP